MIMINQDYLKLIVEYELDYYVKRLTEETNKPVEQIDCNKCSHVLQCIDNIRSGNIFICPYCSHMTHLHTCEKNETGLKSIDCNHFDMSNKFMRMFIKQLVSV